jgi:hypothetical protein
LHRVGEDAWLPRRSQGSGGFGNPPKVLVSKLRFTR